MNKWQNNGKATELTMRVSIFPAKNSKVCNSRFMPTVKWLIFSERRKAAQF